MTSNRQVLLYKSFHNTKVLAILLDSATISIETVLPHITQTHHLHEKLTRDITLLHDLAQDEVQKYSTHGNIMHSCMLWQQCVPSGMLSQCLTASIPLCTLANGPFYLKKKQTVWMASDCGYGYSKQNVCGSNQPVLPGHLPGHPLHSRHSHLTCIIRPPFHSRHSHLTCVTRPPTRPPSP